MDLRKKSASLINYFANKELVPGAIIRTIKSGTDFIVGDYELCDDRIIIICNPLCHNYYRENEFKVIGEPVTIGTVLEKIIYNAQEIGEKLDLDVSDDVIRKCGIIDYWIGCGINRSLNKIFGCAISRTGSRDGVFNEQFIDQNTQSLFEFLWNIFGEEITNKK